MCDPVTIGYILTAVGTGASAVNQNRALKRKDQEAAAGIRRQGDIQEESNQRVNEQIQDLAENTGQQERQQSLQGYLDTLRASRDSTEGALPGVPGASDRYADRVASGRSEVKGAGEASADRLSRINAPAFQRMGESADINRTGVDLQGDKRRSSAEEFLTRLRVANQRPNPWVDAISSVMKGAGGVMAMNPAAGGGANIDALTKAGTMIDAPITNNPYFRTLA